MKLFNFIQIAVYFNYSVLLLNCENVNKWKNLCLHSQNNELLCKMDKIYYLNRNFLDWDEARLQCALKFDGSTFALLPEMSSNLSSDIKSTIKSLLNETPNSITNSTIKIWMNGICYLEKINDTDKRSCKWITSEEHFNITSTISKDKNIAAAEFYLDDHQNVYYNLTIHDPEASNKLWHLCVYTNPLLMADSLEICNINNDFNGKYNIEHWPQVRKGDIAIANCPKDYINGFAFWKCLNNGNFDPNGPNINCTQKWIIELIKNSSYSNNLYKTIELSDSLFNTIQNHQLNYFGDIDQLINCIIILRSQLEKYKTQFNLLDDTTTTIATPISQFIENILKISNNLLNQNTVWKNMKKEQKTYISSQMLLQLQFSTSLISCGANNDFDNYSHIREFNTENIFFKMLEMSDSQMIVKSNRSLTSIDIPLGAVNQTNNSSKCKQMAFGTIYDKMHTHLIGNLNFGQIVNSKVISFSFSNTTQSIDLNQEFKVKIRLEHYSNLSFGDKISCSYWHFNNNSLSESYWSTVGCNLEPLESTPHLSVCLCDHLTNFAALMDISGRETNQPIKSIITKCLCGLSVFAMLSTIAIMTLTPSLRDRKNTITCNICICLIISNLLVVFGMDATHNEVLCKTISALLLYSLLSAFFWMFNEGYHVFQKLVIVFNSWSYLRLWHLYVIGYAAPALVFSIDLIIIGFDGLKGDYFCWISSAKYPRNIWALAGPVTVIIIVNMIISIMCWRSIKSTLRLRTNQNTTLTNTNITKMENKLFQIKGYLSLLILLGFTWISYVLYIHEFDIFFFSYVFIVLNSSQGMFIFMFQILLNPKVKSLLKRHFLNYKLTMTSFLRTDTTKLFSNSSKSTKTSKLSPNNDNKYN